MENYLLHNHGDAFETELNRLLKECETFIESVPDETNSLDTSYQVIPKVQNQNVTVRRSKRKNEEYESSEEVPARKSLKQKPVKKSSLGKECAAKKLDDPDPNQSTLNDIVSASSISNEQETLAPPELNEPEPSNQNNHAPILQSHIPILLLPNNHVKSKVEPMIQSIIEAISGLQKSQEEIIERQKVQEELIERQKVQEELLKELKSSLQRLELKEEEILALKKRNDVLHDLNVRLQTRLLKVLDKGQLESTTLKQLDKENTFRDPDHNMRCFGNLDEKGELEREAESNSTPLDNLPGSEGELERQAESNSTPLDNLPGSKDTLVTEGIYVHDDGTILKWRDGKMDLVPGVTISNEQWENVIRGKKVNASKFTRNLSVTIWGSAELAKRSVTGAPCRRFMKDNIKAKKALTPIKIDAVQNGLRFFLRENMKMEEKKILSLSSSVAIRKMLSDKIMDLNKAKKKIFK